VSTVIRYIKDYYNQSNKLLLLLVSLFTALLVFINYHFGLDEAVRNNIFPVKLLCWSIVFGLALIIPYLLTALLEGSTLFRNRSFTGLLLIAVFLFALKISADFHFSFSKDPGWNHYWNQVIYWPLLLLLLGSLLVIVWKFFHPAEPFYGLRLKGISWRPYWLMLLFMIPLIALASTQADFQSVYPKMRSIEGLMREENLQWWHALLFEVSYGTDFITIEFFFRGFLVLAFVKWAGKDAILPMACFYCSIHFGKPMGECISSYFGGLLLGIVVYNTRSVFGGLMVHLGIAWMMEVAGWVARAV